MAGLGIRKEETAITEAVTSLAHRLSLQVVAEGVETEVQRRLVEEMGSDFGQGSLGQAAATGRGGGLPVRSGAGR